MTDSLAFYHIGDIHLGARFGQLPPEVAAGKKASIRSTLKKIVEQAVKRKINFILFAGDLFDSTLPARDDIAFVREQLERLRHAGIDTYAIPGNHDWHDHNSFWTRADLPFTKLFLSYEFETYEASDYPLRVVGIALDRTHSSVNKLRTLKLPPSPAPTILLMHAAFQNFGRELERDYPFALEDLQKAPFTYGAFGHYHACIQILDQPAKQAYYAGTIEGLDFTPSECGPRYILHGGLAPDHVVLTPEEVTGQLMLARSLDAIETTQDQLEDILRSNAGKSTLFQIGLNGIATYELLKSLESLQERYRSRYRHLEIVDRTLGMPAFDLAASSTYQGLFYEELKKIMAATDDPQQQRTIKQALELGLAAFEEQR